MKYLSRQEVHLLKNNLKKVESYNIELSAKVKDLEDAAEFGQDKLMEANVKLQEAFENEKNIQNC